MTIQETSGVWGPDMILWYALRHSRPHGSKAIRRLVQRIIALADASGPAVIFRDVMENLWIDLRGQSGARTMFAAHLDTVAVKPGQHEIYLKDGIISTGGKAVLGADDGAGIGVLCSLIAARVPALYLFTQDEESGGSPARYAATKEKARVQEIDRCIAFDRKGKDEICGDQMYGTLASSEFVTALSDALGMGHVWGHGTYTDSSEFCDLIPEIVNISVGYEKNHSKNETLDLDYYNELRAAVLAVDWESLPTVGAPPDQGWGSRDYFGPSDGWMTSNYPMDLSPNHGRRKPHKKAITLDPLPDYDRGHEVTLTLWSICETIGIDTMSYEAGLIRNDLDKLADALVGASYGR